MIAAASAPRVIQDFRSMVAPLFLLRTVVVSGQTFPCLVLDAACKRTITTCSVPCLIRWAPAPWQITILSETSLDGVADGQHGVHTTSYFWGRQGRRDRPACRLPGLVGQP